MNLGSYNPLNIIGAGVINGSTTAPVTLAPASYTKVIEEEVAKLERWVAIFKNKDGKVVLRRLYMKRPEWKLAETSNIGAKIYKKIEEKPSLVVIYQEI